MDAAYLHLITNHIPIIGVPLAAALLLLGLWRKSDELKAAAFLIFVFLGVAALGTYLLGQGGEDFVEGLAGVSEDAIDAHEDFARLALAATAALAALSLFALVRYRGLSFLGRKATDKERLIKGDGASSAAADFPKWIVLAVLLCAFLSCSLLGYTGKLGGKIRHPEFSGTQPTGADEDGKNRRGRNFSRPEKVPPIAEKKTAEQPPENDAEEAEEGKGRGRKRGEK